MNFDEAVKLLKNAVKFSHIDDQKHIDLTLVDASQRQTYQNALVIVNRKVAVGEMTREELRHTLGLN
jgi:hypothetical protein